MQQEAGSGARPACLVGSRASSWMRLCPASSSPPRLQGHWVLTQAWPFLDGCHGQSLEGALGSRRGTGVGSGEQAGLIRGHPATARPPQALELECHRGCPHPLEDLQGLQTAGRVGPDFQQPRVSPAEGLTRQPGVSGPRVQERGAEATRD